ncbi:MAG: 3'(2'),5'-bisphosphate nucleotidase, partial [Anaerolineales bacterium]
MITINTPEVRFAMEAVRQAAQTVIAVQKEMVTENLIKEDRSPVTVADFTSQAIIARQLRQSFPNDVLVAEE